MQRTQQSIALAAELDEELAAVGKSRRLKSPLVWTAQEAAVIGLVCDQVDRKVELQSSYDAAGDEPKLQVKLSTEMRLLETSIARLLRQIKTDVPAPESLTTVKARAAVNARWDKARAQSQ